MELVYRNVMPIAEETLETSPIAVISGARQAGKSTLAEQLVAQRDARFLTLDSAVDRAAAQADPDGFAGQYPDGLLVIDEIQRVPPLLLSIKQAADRGRRPGQFLLTGSADLLTAKGAQESLAGRAQSINLSGFSRGELAGHREDFASFCWSLPGPGTIQDIPDITRRDYLALAGATTFPGLRDTPMRVRSRWLGNYVERVLSKDALEVSTIYYPDRLRPLLDLLAASNAAEFVAAHAARLLDVPARSIPAYLRALRDTFLIRELPAWGNNVAKRVVSRPKIVLNDPGLAAHLTGADTDSLERDISSTLTGGLVEGFVATELAKQQAWSAVDYRLHHFRDNDGREVDLVLENPRREFVGIEVKATTSVSQRHFKGLGYLRDKGEDRFIAGIVLHTGTRAVSFGDRLWALPIGSLWRC